MKTKKIAALLAGALFAVQCTPVLAEETVSVPEITDETAPAEEHKWGNEVDYDAFAPYQPFYELKKKIADYLMEHREIVWADLGVKMDLENPENSKIDGHVRDEDSLKAIEDYVVSLGYSKDILMIAVDADFIPVPDIGYAGIAGDIDNNGTVDLTDLSLLSLYLVGDNSLTLFQSLAADVDKDSDVTLADLAVMRQYLSKQISFLGHVPESSKPENECSGIYEYAVYQGKLYRKSGYWILGAQSLMKKDTADFKTDSYNTESVKKDVLVHTEKYSGETFIYLKCENLEGFHEYTEMNGENDSEN